MCYFTTLNMWPILVYDHDVYMTLSYAYPCVVSPKENKIKRNINNNLSILLSHDTRDKRKNLTIVEQWSFLLIVILQVANSFFLTCSRSRKVQIFPLFGHLIFMNFWYMLLCVYTLFSVYSVTIACQCSLL